MRKDARNRHALAGKVHRCRTIDSLPVPRRCYADAVCSPRLCARDSRHKRRKASQRLVRRVCRLKITARYRASDVCAEQTRQPRNRGLRGRHMLFVQWRGSPTSAIGHPQARILMKPIRLNSGVNSGSVSSRACFPVRWCSRFNALTLQRIGGTPLLYCLLGE